MPPSTIFAQMGPGKLHVEGSDMLGEVFNRCVCAVELKLTSSQDVKAVSHELHVDRGQKFHLILVLDRCL